MLPWTRSGRGRLALSLVVVLGLLARAPREPEPCPSPRGAVPSVRAEVGQVPTFDLGAWWDGPFRRLWTRVPLVRPALWGVLAGRLALEGALEVPLLHVTRPLQQLRGLRFKHAVPWTAHTPEQMRRMIAGSLERDYPLDRSDFDALLLGRLGLVPQGFALRGFLLDLMAEQVQGAYDPRTGWFYVLQRQKNWFSRALSSGGPDEADLVTLHELDHALQDQHFDLRTLQEALQEPRNSDREMGLAALVEGDATLVMLQHTVVSQGGSPGEVGPIGWMSDWTLAMPGMGRFSSAPLYFRRALVLPYFAGMDLVNRAYVQGGWEAVNRLYRDPPASTEQVLHPEKYLARRDPPRTVSIPFPRRWQGWSEVGEDTGGEFMLSVLLEQHGAPGAEMAARGWGGDRLRLYRRGREVFLVWLTVWDGPGEAGRFARAFGEARGRLPGSWHVWHTGDRVALMQDLPPGLLEQARRRLREGQAAPPRGRS